MDRCKLTSSKDKCYGNFWMLVWLGKFERLLKRQKNAN